MDISVIIIALVFVAIFIIPFIYVQRLGEIKKKKFLKAFENMAGKHQLNITEKEFWDHTYAIGLDQSSKKLIYVVKKNDHFEDTVINLNDVDSCLKGDGNKVLKNGDSFSRLPERLVLVFTFKGQKYPEQMIDFYIESVNSALTEENNILSKWQKKIRDVIGNR